MNGKNQPNYIKKIVRILEELKENHPDINISRHYMLATSECEDAFYLDDKDLYEALQNYKTEMDMNTLSDRDLQKVIEETDDLFQEVEYPDFDRLELQEDFDGEDYQ